MLYYSELYHHGILGQKWGVRRYRNADGTLTELGKRKVRAANYSDKQYKQDERLYGKKGAERINKRMNEGEGIMSARHAEVVSKKVRKNGFDAVKKGIALAAAAGTLAYNVSPEFRNKVNSKVANMANMVLK